jgi:beta-galactosidase
MTRTSFNAGWTVRPKVSIFAQLGRDAPEAQPVTLPHDALLSQPRSPEGEAKNAYFPLSSAFEYSKAFEVPEEYCRKRVSIEFQGAYRDAMVYVNGMFAAQRPYGYSTFTVPLDSHLAYGGSNTIRVDVRAHDDSRWYTGCGMLRDTVLVVQDLVHLAPSSLRLTTPDIDEERAVVELAVKVANAGTRTRTVTVDAEIADDAGAMVARGTAPVTLAIGDTEVVRHRLYVRSPRCWSVDDPYLYTARVTVSDGGRVLDEETARLGIRSLRLDPIHGLRINGAAVKLRGACVHHDNGLLGGAAVARAEHRRVELLKEAGFNAIRAAHNPLSQPMLDACDRVGMLVMDEAFDVWAEGKSSFDYSLAFPEWWERDIEAMVAKDFNHPSVILYSIGNEIPETGNALGSQIGRRLAEKVRELDGSRFVTNAVNAFVSVLPEVMAKRPQRQTVDAGSAGVNDFMNSAGAMMAQISASQLATERTAESFSVLDIGGINYGESRYENEPALFPNRILIGSETFPGRIDVNWRLVLDHRHVLGDFTWTGWDYLGEVGIGRLRYHDEPADFSAPYPWRTAWTGDLDITGFRRPVSYYREVVFGIRSEPYIAVVRPESQGRNAVTGGWSWPDVVSSWTWATEPGTPMTVEVYSAADEVELLLNGNSVGRTAAGAGNGYRAVFKIAYQPGELAAVAYKDGAVQGRSVLQTAAADFSLVLEPDRSELTAADGDLAFIQIALRDAAGVLVTNADRIVQAEVSGAGELLSLGSGSPKSEESFETDHARSFDGRLLAVVRPSGPGSILVTARAEGLGDAQARLTVFSE